MRALIRKVCSAKVEVENKLVSEIGEGLLIYLAIQSKDSLEDLSWIQKKILGIRLFQDELGKVNQPISPRAGILVVSQFTLFGTLRKGFRPSFHRAATPGDASEIYNEFLLSLNKSFDGTVRSGVFGENMLITAVDDGPVSIWIDSRFRDY